MPGKNDTSSKPVEGATIEVRTTLDVYERTEGGAIQKIGTAEDLAMHRRRAESSDERAGWPGLTTERACEEAQAWAEWRRWADRRKAAGDLDAEYEGAWDPHDDDRAAALESWVRDTMRKSPATTKTGKCWAVIEALREDGGPQLLESKAWTLCEQAGWPS